MVRDGIGISQDVLESEEGSKGYDLAPGFSGAFRYITIDDQLLQYNQTDKMLQQIAGEDDIKTTSHLNKAILAEELVQIESEESRQEKEDKLRDKALPT